MWQTNTMNKCNTNKYNRELTQTPSSKHDEVYLTNLQVCERKKIAKVVTCEAC